MSKETLYNLELTIEVPKFGNLEGYHVFSKNVKCFEYLIKNHDNWKGPFSVETHVINEGIILPEYIKGFAELKAKTKISDKKEMDNPNSFLCDFKIEYENQSISNWLVLTDYFWGKKLKDYSLCTKIPTLTLEGIYSRVGKDKKDKIHGIEKELEKHWIEEVDILKMTGKTKSRRSLKDYEYIYQVLLKDFKNLRYL